MKIRFLFDENMNPRVPNAQKNGKAARFQQLRQMAAQNAALNELSETEALALVEEVRQKVYQLGKIGTKKDFKSWRNF